jgi:hypothetical protein
MEYDDQLYDELIEAEEQLENTTNQLVKIRLERRIKFLNDRILEMEEYLIANEENIKIKEEEDRINGNIIFVTSILSRFFQYTIDKTSFADATTTSVKLAILLQDIRRNIRSYNVDLTEVEELKVLSLQLLDTVNNNSNLILDYSSGGARIERTISNSMNSIFEIFNMDKVEVEFDMNTDLDEEFAKKIQMEFDNNPQ